MKVEREIIDIINGKYKEDSRYLLDAEVQYDSAAGEFDSRLISLRPNLNLSDELQHCIKLLGHAAFYTWLTDGRFHEPIPPERVKEMLFGKKAVPLLTGFETTYMGDLTSFLVSQDKRISAEYFRLMHESDEPFKGKIRVDDDGVIVDNGFYKIYFDCKFEQLEAKGKMELIYIME